MTPWKVYGTSKLEERPGKYFFFENVLIRKENPPKI